MGELLGLLDGILDITDLYERYGIRGCALMVLAFFVILGIIIAIASFLQ